MVIFEAKIFEWQDFLAVFLTDQKSGSQNLLFKSAILIVKTVIFGAKIGGEHKVQEGLYWGTPIFSHTILI